MARVIIVVPCYNEERRLRPQAFLSCAIPGHRLDFLFVNDGSNDRTLMILQELTNSRPETCQLLDLAHNRGKAEAVRQGFLAALARRPDFVGFWDADLATPLDEIPVFLQTLEEDPRRQMVFGARVRLMGRTIERLAFRHYLGRVFATAVSMTLGIGIYDTQCGAKLFRATGLLERVIAEPFRTKWIFDVEIVARFIHLSRLAGRDTVVDAIYELPLRQWRDVRGSKLRTRDFIQAAMDLCWIRRTYFRGNVDRRS